MEVTPEMERHAAAGMLLAERLLDCMARAVDEGAVTDDREVLAALAFVVGSMLRQMPGPSLDEKAAFFIEQAKGAAVAIGEGTLLSPASHAAQIAPDLLGFGSPLEGCPACRTLDEAYSYGLGVVLSGRGFCRTRSSSATAPRRRISPARRLRSR